MKDDERLQQVVVIGGGYAGVLAANRIAAGAGGRTRVLLVSERDVLVHRIRLHEAAAGRPLPDYPLARLLRHSIQRVQARVRRIDAARRVCELASGAQIPYDQLVYAVGSGPAAGALGLGAHGMALAGPAQAARLAAQLRSLPRGAPVAVVGAGLTGIELAAELAEAHPQLAVCLVGEQLAPGWDDRLRARVHAALRSLGVDVHTGARVAAVDPHALTLDSGARLPATAAVWAAGFAAAPLARDSGLPIDRDGRLLVDATLQVPEHPEIVGCGDAVAVPPSCTGTGIALRMACATALPMAAHAAEVVLDRLRGHPALTFRYRHTAQCVSLGRRRGLLVFIDQDDRPTGQVLDGLQGALAKELICRLVIGTLRLDRWMPGVYTWPGRGARQRCLPAAADLRLLPDEPSVT
jgi:NADH dehydrogenase FAD-containing subunit